MLLQTGAAYVSIERIHSLYGVILLGMDHVESRARRGESWRKIPVALCVTEVTTRQRACSLLKYNDAVLDTHKPKHIEFLPTYHLLLPTYTASLRIPRLIPL